MLDLTKEECKLVEQALGSHAEKLTMDKSRMTGRDQKKQVDEWLQAHSDIVKEISRLRVAIQKTNMETSVAIQLNGKAVEKTIAEWIHRRRDLAVEELKMWNCLTDRGIVEGTGKSPTGDPIEIKIVRFYDPVARDNHRDLFQSEPITIDSKLEVINAITDLIEEKYSYRWR